MPARVRNRPERADSLGSTAGFGGKTVDGTDVVLRIREPCSDGMSGEAFQASAEFTIGASRYRGCGAYLFDCIRCAHRACNRAASATAWPCAVLSRMHHAMRPARACARRATASASRAASS